MKKILLASTVLAMTATVAAAEVTVSGSARMGVAYNSEAPNKTGFTSRARVKFTLSGETDGGLTFGASFDAHNAGGANNGTGGDVNGSGSMSSGSVFMSGAFGKISMGDVDGAAEFAVGDLGGVGLTGLADLNENLYLSNSGTLARSAVRYEYSAGAFAVAFSADNPQFDTVLALPAAPGVFPAFGTTDESNTYAVGAKYTVDTYSFGVGYETTRVYDGFTGTSLTIGHFILGAEASFSGVKVKATYGRASKLDLTQYGVSAGYTMDAIGVSAFYRAAEVGPFKDSALGVGASYDLGGGAKIVGGIVRANPNGPSNSETLADLGVSMSF